MAAGAAKIVEPLRPKDGMTILTFLGRGDGQRTFFGVSATRYVFGGKRHVQGYVFDGDVAGMLDLRENGKPLFSKTVLAKPLQAPAIIQAEQPKQQVEALQALVELVKVDPMEDKPKAKKTKKTKKADDAI